MTVPLRFVNNPWKIEERNLCFVNAPTQAFLNLELTKKHFSGKSFSDLAKKNLSLLKLKGFLSSAVHVQTTKFGVVIKVFVFLGLLKNVFPFFLCPVLLW